MARFQIICIFILILFSIFHFFFLQQKYYLYEQGKSAYRAFLAQCPAHSTGPRSICCMTVTSEINKQRFLNSTKRKRPMVFLEKRKKRNRAELQNQLQRWEWKEVLPETTWRTASNWDSQQLKIDLVLPTDTSLCRQSFTSWRQHLTAATWPQAQATRKKKSTSTAKNNTQPRLLAQVTKASLPPRAEISHRPATERERQWSLYHRWQSQGLRAPRWGGLVQMAPFNPKSWS